MVQFLLTSIAFLAFEATSMFDYGFGFFTLITMANATVIYILFIGQLENTFDFIENCEKFIGKSKSGHNK